MFSQPAGSYSAALGDNHYTDATPSEPITASKSDKGKPNSSWGKEKKGILVI